MVTLLLCIVLILSALYIPVVATVMQVVPPGFEGWLIVLSMSLLPLVIGQIVKIVLQRYRI